MAAMSKDQLAAFTAEQIEMLSPEVQKALKTVQQMKEVAESIESWTPASFAKLSAMQARHPPLRAPFGFEHVPMIVSSEPSNPYSQRSPSHLPALARILPSKARRLSLATWAWRVDKAPASKGTFGHARVSDSLFG
eukprot:4047976-Pyramimonas_sp.AAC.1